MSNSKQNTEAILHGLNGLLLGAGGAALVETLKAIHQVQKHHEKKQKLKAVTLNEAEEKQASADLAQSHDEYVASLQSILKAGGVLDVVGGAVQDAGSGALRGGRWLAEKGIDTLKWMSTPASDNFLRNAAFLLSAGAGAVGVKNVFDHFRKEDAKKRTEQARRYYYERLLETALDEEAVAGVEKIPLIRKEASVPWLDLGAFAAMFGIPLSTAYLTYNYLNEKMPGNKQPLAKNDKDPKSTYYRVLRQDKPDDDDEDDAQIKIFDGIGKAASGGPALDRAFELGHTVNTLLANADQTSQGYLPDIVCAVARGHAEQIRKSASDLFAVGEVVEKYAHDYDSLSARERALAVDLISVDPILSAVVAPIAHAEFYAQFPTAVKAAANLRPQSVQTSLAFAKAAKLAHEEALFGTPQAHEKRAAVSSYFEHLDQALRVT